MEDKNDIATFFQTQDPTPTQVSDFTPQKILTIPARYAPRKEEKPHTHDKSGDINSYSLNNIGIIHYRDGLMRRRQAEVLTKLPWLVRGYFGYHLLPFHMELLRRAFRLSSEFTQKHWQFRWDRYYRGGDTSDPALRQVGLLPTEHAKSTLGCVVYPVFSLANNPNGAHIVCCNNLREATMRVGVQRAVLSGEDPRFHQFLRDYPWAGQPAKKPWSKTEFTVVGREDRSNINPSVVALGRGARDIKGRRAKFIGDDLEGKEAMRSEERQRLMDWATLEAVRCIEDEAFQDRPLHMYVGTPFDVDSFYYSLAEKGFQTFRLPYRYPPEPGNKTGALIWPAKKGKIEELKGYLNRKQFAIAMRLDPTGGDDSVMTHLQLQELSRASASAIKTDEDHFGYVFLDPAAGSKNKNVDYAGLGVAKLIWPVGEDLPFCEVYEPRVFTEGALEQVHYAADLHFRYGYPVIYETNGFQATTYSALFHQHHPEVPLLRHHTSQKKRMDRHMGLSVVKTLMRLGRLKVFGRDLVAVEDEDPDFATAPEGDPDVRAFLGEIRDLDDPNAHNHISAGVWFTIRNAYENRRSSGFKIHKTGTLTGSVATRTGYGGSRTIDLSGFRGGVIKANG